MDLKKVVVCIGGIVVIIDGVAAPVIGHESDPAIAAAVLSMLEEKDSFFQVEQREATVLVAHAPAAQLWNRIPGGKPGDWMADWTPRGVRYVASAEEEVILSVEKPTD